MRLPKSIEDDAFDAVRVPDDPQLAITFLALSVVYRWWSKEHPKTKKGRA